MNLVRINKVMSSTSTKKFMTPSSGKEQKNNMSFNTRKRKRQDSDVAGTPMKKIKVFNIPSPKSCNKVQESVNVRKRKAKDDGEMPRKRIRLSKGPVENFCKEWGKRKASEDAVTSAKRMRYSNSISISVSSSIESSADVSNSSGYGTAGSSTTGSSSISSSEEAFISHIFDNASLEEQKVFEMASSGSTSRAEFEDKYIQQAALGAGGFGSVYAGFRREDSLPVAIKHIPRDMVTRELVVCNGKMYNIILEVALMLKTAGLPGSASQSASISLLDWYVLEHELILVLERPAYSLDLFKYLQIHRGSLPEQEAKMILRQLVDAAIDMHAKGVFHRDIKLENTLIQRSITGDPRLRVIDFGCGSFSTEMSFHSFCGTLKYGPPEWFDSRTYQAHPTTVWQLGALFYSLLNDREYFSTVGFINNHIKINRNLSQDCEILLDMCLVRNPMERATLQELQSFLART